MADPGRNNREGVGLLGPGVTQSALGEHVIGAPRYRQTTQIMGNPDLPHSYSYAPDVARALIRLGNADDSTGEIWHLPIAETVTTRKLIELVHDAAGIRHGSPRLDVRSSASSDCSNRN